jgi:hypothetical protein
MATSSDDPAMDEVIRSFRFETAISVEPGHVAHLDPEWAADAAASALTDGYGIDAYFDDIAALVDGELSTSSGVGSEQRVRSYRFSITFGVDRSTSRTTTRSGWPTQLMERSPTSTAPRPPTHTLNCAMRSR